MPQAGIVAALRIVHQHAGGEIDPAQDLAQLVDLALLAELGDGAEDVRERAPLHLRQHVAADLQRVPAQRPHPAGRELADLHVPRQAGRVEQLPPARAEIEHDGLELPVQRGLVSHAHRGHALAVAGVAAERGVEVRVAAQAQGGQRQVAGLRADLVAEHGFAGQLRVEGQRRQLLLDRDRRALLEQVGRGVRGEHGRREQRAVLRPQQVDAERVAVGRERGPERQRVVAQQRIAGHGEHRGRHVGAVKRLRHQGLRGALAGLGGQQQGRGHEAALVRGGVEQRFEAARDLGQPDRHVVLGLPGAAEGDAGHDAGGQPAGEGTACAQGDRLGFGDTRAVGAAGAGAAAHRLALRPALGDALAPRLGIGDALGDAVGAARGVGHPAAAAHAVRAAAGCSPSRACPRCLWSPPSPRCRRSLWCRPSPPCPRSRATKRSW